ncbi:MAG: putative aminohydrolase SsnA [Anaerolineae bacterium]|nr:putative aminohydrolase SsnA [Anaerolineae bacterium]
MLITNGTLITLDEPNEIIENGALLIEDGRIKALGASAALAAAHPEAEVLDARGQLVMPGNICAHTHFYGAFARGMAIPGAPAQDFPEILQKLWWPLDQALGMEDVKYSALVCLADAVKHGTTTLIDHHASPNALEGSLDVIADAVEQAGLRASLCYEVTDRYGPAKAKASIAENARFLRAAKGRPMIAASFGLHASLTVGDATLAACVEAAQGLDTGFHIHVAEHQADEYDSIQKSGKRIVHRLHDAGILGPKTILVHCVHVDPWELEVIRDTGTWVTHQPRSNMNNAVGAAPIEAMLAGGVKLGLGNDGFSNNMWAEWKAAYLQHKAMHYDPRRAPGDAVAQMAWYNNARLAEMFFPGARIGALAPGAAADIIFVDYPSTTPLSAGNLPWHVIFGFEAGMVTTTIAGGRVLMHNRELRTLDETAITARSRELAAEAWKRYERYARAAL